MTLILRDVLLAPFLIIALGLLVSRFMHLDSGSVAKLSFWIFHPCLVFSSLLDPKISLGFFGQVFLLVVAFSVAMWGVSLLLSRTLSLSPIRTRGVALASVFPNTGNRSFVFGS